MTICYIFEYEEVKSNIFSYKYYYVNLRSNIQTSKYVTWVKIFPQKTNICVRAVGAQINTDQKEIFKYLNMYKLHIFLFIYKCMIINNDCKVFLKRIPDNKIDSMVTDPPAGISFMGKSWDKYTRNDFIKEMSSIYEECLRVLKPGAHAFVWALPRTSHWTATSLEDAGFEIRDIVTHVFGSGFPKSYNIGKGVDKKLGCEREVVGKKRSGTTIMSHLFYSQIFSDEELKHIDITKGNSIWEGWGTNLKPASEHWILCRKPLSEKNIVDNVLKWGTGGINIDKSRVGTETIITNMINTKDGLYNLGNQDRTNEVENTFNEGRFPANFVHDGSDEVMEEFDKAGNSISSDHNSDIGGWQDIYVGGKTKQNTPRVGYRDEGTPARFFYCSKPSSKEKDAAGRFPANFIHDGSEEVMEEFDKAGVSGGKRKIGGTPRKTDSFVCSGSPDRSKSVMNIGDEGTPSRFFYCSKPSSKEKDAGLEDMEEKIIEGRDEGQDERNVPHKNRTSARRNIHPTVKSIKLMKYLITMITPKGGILLDPFMGSGSTGVACGNDFKFLGIEKEKEYFDIAQKRIQNC